MKKQIVLALLLVIALIVILPAVARSPQLTQEISPAPSSTSPSSVSSPTAVSTPGTSSIDPFSSSLGPPPTRDLFDLTLRLRPGVKGPISHVVNKETPQYTMGQKQVFWLTDLADYNHFQINTILRYVSPHAYFYVEDGIDIGDSQIRQGADDFENIVLPSDRKYFGTEWVPGVDNDPHLTIVLAKFQGAAGYYSMSDEYPVAVNQYSNEREMFYLSFPSLKPGTPGFPGTLAHEYEHAIHWNQQPNQQTWIAEGSAELAAVLAGYQPVGMTNFLSAPDTQLTGWTEEAGSVHRYYGAAYLFMRYLFQHYGGYDSIKDFLAEKETGVPGINTYLKKKGYMVDFDGVFKDWVIANYLDDPGNGPYGYPDEKVKVSIEGTIDQPKEITASVSQYGSDYYDIQLPSGDAVIEFHGDPNTKLIAGTPHSGNYEWWGNRGDSVDSRLTKEFDLAGLRTATLKFWTWYDIEDKWDYAYVEASTDGGASWETLPGNYTTKEDPIGNSFGNGYTGESGGRGSPEWVEDSIDLSRFAGKKILLRFEYITDEGLNKSGIAIDDITIPELGFKDDAESDAGWKAEGFVRTTDLVKQRFLVQVIKSGPGGYSVETMPLDGGPDGESHFRGFGTDLKRATLVVSGFTPTSSEIAPYRFSVSYAK